MVYKILGEFDSNSFDIIFTKLGNYFKFLFKNGNLYLSLINIEDEKKGQELINSLFKSNNDFLVLRITEKNIMKEDKFIVEWCRDNLVNLDKQKYELENQEKIKNMMLILDNFENILENMRKEGLNGKGNKQTDKEKRQAKKGT